jgi:hypothetical protein
MMPENARAPADSERNAMAGDQPSPSWRKEITDIRNHIPQIEALLVYCIIVVITLHVLGAATAQQQVTLPLWLVPSVFLVGLRGVIRVTNPTGQVRNALTWAAVLGGVVGAIGGATADLLAGGLTAGQGTLLGYAGGVATGAAVGNWIEGWGKNNELLQRGDAFDLLYRFRKRRPFLANATLVEEALDKWIPGFDKNRDGRFWYSTDDLGAFIDGGPEAILQKSLHPNEFVSFLSSKLSVPATQVMRLIRESSNTNDFLRQVESVAGKETRDEIEDLLTFPQVISDLNTARTHLGMPALPSP